MVKKRRLLGSPNPGPSKTKSDGRGDDVTVARALLKEALQDIIHSDDESSSSQEEAPPKPVPIKKEQKPAVIRRRKRKNTVDLELAFQNTYVMKMFDRSVDLAQFKEDTPLYPICRAWIANQPRVPPPFPPLEDAEIKKEDEMNLFDFVSEEVRDVYKMPPPSSSSWPNRIPSLEPSPLQGVSLDYNSEHLPTAEDLLDEHLSKWANVRRKWIEAAQTNEARFARSGKILSSMYRRSD